MSLTFDQEFTKESRNQDFELFPSTTQTIDHHHANATSSVTTSAFEHGSENMTPPIKGEEAWLAWCHATTAQDMHTIPVMKARTKPSISDSGYGSVDYTDAQSVEALQKVPMEPLNSEHDQAPQFCLVCYEEAEKYRYFSNNADRRLGSCLTWDRTVLTTCRKHMLTHTRPFKCDVSGCDNHNGFASPHDLARHKKTCHSVLTVKTSKFYYRCAAPSCQKKDKIWPRKDNFKAHLEGTHKYNESEVAGLLVKSVVTTNGHNARLMFLRSECTPDSSQLPTSLVSRQKSKSKKPKNKPCVRNKSSPELESSIGSESSAEESQQELALDDCVRDISRYAHVMPTTTPELLHTISSLSQANSTLEQSHLPCILISDDPETDICEQTSPVEMMDTSTDFMGEMFSPYLMVCVPSSLQDLERPSTPCSSSTYADSLFESDIDEITTDTEFEIDVDDLETVFQPLLRPAIHQLLSAYYLFRQNGPASGAGRSSSSSYPSSFDSHAGAYGFGPNGAGNSSFGTKRRRNGMGQEDDNEDEQPPKRKSKVAKSEDDLPPLACPFSKFDPLKHDKCYTFVLKGISRVNIPIHCPKCYAIFRNNTEARDRHVRQGTCHNAPERRLEGIDEITMRKLKRRVTSKSVKDSWYSMYTLLFPDATWPESPFMDTSLSAELLAFRDFCTNESQDIVTTIINNNMPSWTGDQQEQVEDFTRQVSQRAIEQLFLEWQNRGRSTTSAPAMMDQPLLPPTPPSTFVQDLNEMGTFAITAEEPLFDLSQQYQDVDMQQWIGSEPQPQLQQQWMYFGEVMPMNQGQQFWNDNGVLDGMGGWSG
ncbi:hypothetical protein E4T42_03847 [Aureobasidium subglaciale]|nr:hypothetical protein E4T42_03847 [Aureobasidium subglaciale]